jgi:hypothetical protein
MGIAGVVLAAATMLQAGQTPIRHPQPPPDPIADLARVEVRVTTTAPAARLRVLDEALTVGVGRIESGTAPVIAFVDTQTLVVARNPEGATATCVFRLVVSSVAPTLRLALAGSGAHPVTIEILNLNDEVRPAAVTRFTAVDGTELQTSMALLRTGGPLPAPAPRERLVLAHYYPWWDRPSWADPRLIDQPLQLYSTDDPADVARVLRDIAAAGIDVAIVSWQGSAARGGFYARGLRHVLDAAQQAGLRVAVMLETPIANRAFVEGATPEPRVLADWMVELAQTYATHPAFLKVDGRPVLFAYAWGFAGLDIWAEARSLAAAAGHSIALMADTTNSPELVVADGTFTYSGTLSDDDVAGVIRRSVSGARTYHLLGAAYGSQRIAAASVIPGYDETRLGRTTRLAVDREGGEFYDRQWAAARASGAEWVVITSWNEWAENTQIEAGQRFGQAYIWRTRFWSAAFTLAPR